MLRQRHHSSGQKYAETYSLHGVEIRTPRTSSTDRSGFRSTHSPVSSHRSLPSSLTVDDWLRRPAGNIRDRSETKQLSRRQQRTLFSERGAASAVRGTTLMRGARAATRPVFTSRRGESPEKAWPSRSLPHLRRWGPRAVQRTTPTGMQALDC